KSARHIRKRGRPHRLRPRKTPAAEGIPRVRDEIVEDLRRQGAQFSADSEQAIRPQPEIEGREVVNGRIDEKNVHRTLNISEFAPFGPSGMTIAVEPLEIKFKEWPDEQTLSQSVDCLGRLR